jgi:WD40 repeat protein
VDALAFRPDGLQLATGSAIADPLSHHGGYRIWNVMSAAEQPLEAAKYAVSALAFRPDNRELAIAYRGDGGYWCINLIALDQDRLLRRYVAHRKGISAVAFTPDGKWLVSVGHDGAIRCWH